MPSTSHGGAAGTRARIPAMSSRSVLAGELNSPCFTDDSDLDLAGILQLVLDPLGDVLRQPDGFFVGHLLAFDDDADFAAGLERERLRDPLERIGDALGLLQPLHVRLQDVSARAWTGGRNRVGRLD